MPEEIALKKQATALRAYLATLTDKVARKAAMADLAQSEMRQTIAEEAQRRFLMRQDRPRERFSQLPPLHFSGSDGSLRSKRIGHVHDRTYPA